MKYTEEQKTTALDLYVKVGPRAASRETHVPTRTISRWARERGVSTEATAKTADATAAAKAVNDARRERIKEKLLEKAEDMLGRMDSPHLEAKVLGQGVGEPQVVQLIELPAPTPSGCREYATTVGILIDKFRLENGEAERTSKVEHSGGIAVTASLSDDQLDTGIRRLLEALQA